MYSKVIQWYTHTHTQVVGKSYSWRGPWRWIFFFVHPSIHQLLDSCLLKWPRNCWGYSYSSYKAYLLIGSSTQWTVDKWLSNIVANGDRGCREIDRELGRHQLLWRSNNELTLNHEKKSVTRRARAGRQSAVQLVAGTQVRNESRHMVSEPRVQLCQSWLYPVLWSYLCSSPIPSLSHAANLQASCPAWPCL